MTIAHDPHAFSMKVTEDYTWRVREISDLKQIVRVSGASYSSVARKAALTLLYAHWEGHVLFVAEAYLQYVAIRKPKMRTLIAPFRAIKLGGMVKEWQEQRDLIILRMKIVNAILNMDAEQFKSVPKGAVETGGNLNFYRFSNICEMMKIDANKIIIDASRLDDELLGVRNKIAHGNYISVTDERLEKMVNYVLEIMRQFRTEVENCITLGTYQLTK